MKVIATKLIDKNSIETAKEQCTDLINDAVNECLREIPAEIQKNNLHEFEAEDYEQDPSKVRITVRTIILTPEDNRTIHRNLMSLLKHYPRGEAQTNMIVECIRALTGNPTYKAPEGKLTERSVYPDTSDMPIESSN